MGQGLTDGERIPSAADQAETTAAGAVQRRRALAMPIAVFWAPFLFLLLGWPCGAHPRPQRRKATRQACRIVDNHRRFTNGVTLSLGRR
jgi:hypothetical protein